MLTEVVKTCGYPQNIEGQRNRETIDITRKTRSFNDYGFSRKLVPVVGLETTTE